MKVELTEQEVSDLKKVRNYFGTNDISLLEHMAYGLLDRIINNITNEVGLGVVKKLNWINVNDKMPEIETHLLKKLDDELNVTKNVIVITDHGTISDNRRVKMAVGNKEWAWVMGYDGGEIITHWVSYEEPKQ